MAHLEWLSVSATPMHLAIPRSSPGDFDFEPLDSFCFDLDSPIDRIGFAD
jgi:hypothetical protein